jgi:hypothetical protein
MLTRSSGLAGRLGWSLAQSLGWPPGRERPPAAKRIDFGRKDGGALLVIESAE